MRFKDENEHPSAKQFVNDYFVNFLGLGQPIVDTIEIWKWEAPFCKCFLTLIFVVMFEMDVTSSAREVQGVATSHHDDEHVSVQHV